MRNSSLIICIAICSAGCNSERFEPIHIAVYPSTMTCAIKETPLDCSTLPEYLAKTLKAPATREITVSFAGTEEVPKEDKSIDRIAELIRKSGYKNVNVYRFGLK